MSTLLEQPNSRARPRANSTATDAAQRLKAIMAATRVSIQWFGIRRTLTPEQKAEAAEPFGAEAAFLSAGKKLLDTSHPAYKAVTSIRNKAVQLWRAMSLPYPEPGVRLIRQDKIDEFAAQMTEFQEELAEAVQTLDEYYAELKSAAQEKLGHLYSASDYPESLQGLFEIQYDFPSLSPPDYLQQLNPALYEQECQRVQQRFDEAVRLAEEAFVAELSKMVSHLVERLAGDTDGKPKIFRDSAVENLGEFFQRFKQLNVRSNEQLDHSSAKPKGRSAVSSPRNSARASSCGSTWPWRWPAYRASLTACLSTGRGEISSAGPGSRRCYDAASHPAGRLRPLHLL